MQPSKHRNAKLRRKAALVLLPLAVAAILVATLRQGSITNLDPWAACLLCGLRGTAAAIVNIILFLPFGVALGLLGWGWRRTALAAAALSLSVELMQMGIGGRNPSFGDLLFNTIGGAVGALALTLAPLWLRPSPRASGTLSLLAALAAAGTVAATGLLLAPSYPANTYYGQWTPDLGHLEPYDGTVLDASLGNIPIGPRRLPDSDAVRAALIQRAPLHATAVAGSPPPGLASLVSIYDAGQREIVLLGPDRDDLVFRYRTRAKALLLDQPDIRALGLTRGTAPGDSINADAVTDSNGYCLRWGSRRECGLGFTAGHGWALLYYKDGFPQWFKQLLGLAWVAGLALPFGLWARRRWTTAVGATVLAGSVILLPNSVGLLATPATDIGAAGAGALVGALISALAARRPNSRR